MNLTVNKLPTKTWNHLNMNQTNISLEGEFKNHTPSVSFDAADAYYNENEKADLNEKAFKKLSDLTDGTAISFVKVSKNEVMENPIFLTYDYEENEKGASRLYLKAEENSILKAVVVLKSEKKAQSVLDIFVDADKNACVKIYLAQMLSGDSLCINNIGASCGEGARVRLTRLELGAKKAYNNVEIDLNGKNSSFNTEIGYHAVEDQLLDMNYVTYHYGKTTEALMEINGTLEENSKKLFRGTIDFKQGCAGSKGTESENVLLLGENMTNGTIPIILCAEEDVEGNHGASIGKLDEKVLFYLASRGISEHDAQNIIAMSRIDNICSKFPNEELRQSIRNFELKRGTLNEQEL